MKKLFAFVMVLMLCGTAFADTGIDWSQYPDDELLSTIDDLVEMLDEAQAELDSRGNDADIGGIMADYNQTEAIKSRINETLQQYWRMVLFPVDSITVNPNLGTTADGDFIALFYMTYDDKTDRVSDYNLIVKCATNVATVIHQNIDEICEMAVFVELPKYNSSAKIQFLINEKGGLEYGDALFPKSMIVGDCKSQHGTARR